ncbi:MAG: glycosyltransferase [Paracoccaceae bacterium]
MQIDDFEVRTFPDIATVGLSDAQHRLRVCIVTEEIIGPVRNGGIASTYYHLSKGLAAAGHEVHVLFLKGAVVQDETPQHWVDHFAEFGVTLHYLEFPARPCWGAAVEWQERFVAAYHWLRDRPAFDVVHTSEWRGGMTYALMAKRLGLAFAETLFLVKTSSPHIWNRHYQMQPIERRELVLASYAEQKCVELADAVIGGSAHLISFMDRIGYAVPDDNVFVQPNIVDFSHVPVTDARPPRAHGDVVRTRELCFFGRLEGRKGVELMAGALDILTARGAAPDKVTFLGKWGAPLATQGDARTEDYLKDKAKRWPFEVEYVTDRNQPAALSYMCGRDMIAVMPSLIENSTMAVYETLENRIPFIATAVGGTPELIDPADHATALVAPKATALADRLEAALRDGQPIAHPSFSNDENLRVWYGFHAHVGEMIAERGRAQAIAELTAPMDAPGTPATRAAWLMLARRGDDLDALVAALTAERPDLALIGVNDAGERAAVEAAVDELVRAGVEARVLDCTGMAAGDVLHALTQAARGASDAWVVAHGASALPRPGLFDAVRAGLSHRPGCLMTTFFRGAGDVLGLPMGGDVASQILTSRAYGPEIVALRPETYDRLGRFEPYDVRAGIVHEYVTRAVHAGPDDLLVHPEELIDWPDAATEGAALTGDAVYAYLKAKPLLDAASLPARKVLLSTLHAARTGGSPFRDQMLRDSGRPADALMWLIPPDWDREGLRAPIQRRLTIALDETRDELLLYARGRGEPRLYWGEALQAIEPVASRGTPGEEDFVGLWRFPLGLAMTGEDNAPLSWSIWEGGAMRRNLFARIVRVAPRTLAVSAREAIVTPRAIRRLFATGTVGRALRGGWGDAPEQRALKTRLLAAMEEDGALLLYACAPQEARLTRGGAVLELEPVAVPDDPAAPRLWRHRPEPRPALLTWGLWTGQRRDAGAKLSLSVEDGTLSLAPTGAVLDPDTLRQVHANRMRLERLRARLGQGAALRLAAGASGLGRHGSWSLPGGGRLRGRKR